MRLVPPCVFIVLGFLITRVLVLKATAVGAAVDDPGAGEVALFVEPVLLSAPNKPSRSL